MCRTNFFLWIFLLFLGSCQYDQGEINRSGAPLLKEDYFNGETGELIAVKEYIYNELDQVQEEHYRDLATPDINKKIDYQYLPSGKVKSKTIHYYNQDRTRIFEYEYAGDKVLWEIEYDDDMDFATQKEFFYQGDRLDSIRYYGTVNGDLYYEQTELFIYKDGKLAEVGFVMSRGVYYANRLYSYEGENVSECSQGNYCTKYIYKNGRLEKVLQGRKGNVDQLLEEYSYQDNLLIEKKIFQRSVYTLGNILNIVRIRYEYREEINMDMGQ